MGIAFAMGAIAKEMPERSRFSDDQLFLAGMLHDIGYMVLAHLDTESSNALYTGFLTQSDRPILEIEQELLGMTHCEIGAQLGLRWGLPKEIIAVIRYHHTPAEDVSIEGQPLVSMLKIAEQIHPEFCSVKQTEKQVTEQAWIGLGIDPAKNDDIRNHIADVAAQANEFACAF